MDEETKKYFEELTDTAEEAQIELTKAGSSALRTRSSDRDLSEETEGQLTIDVYQTSNFIVIESTIAGVKPEDLDIDITNESVTIKGSREKEEKISDNDYIYQECYWGRFSRSVILPQEVDPEAAEASMKNGILTIKLPKLDRHRAKKLKVHFS
ncbi:MAG TPA: Hsp20/alpha crystallin family protein [Candidatus Paceibacterota bacterium]